MRAPGARIAEAIGVQLYLNTLGDRVVRLPVALIVLALCGAKRPRFENVDALNYRAHNMGSWWPNGKAGRRRGTESDFGRASPCERTPGFRVSSQGAGEGLPTARMRSLRPVESLARLAEAHFQKRQYDGGCAVHFCLF